MVMGGAGGGLTVSVVVLTRNRPSELSMCLEALKGLTVRPLEVIVVDDSDGDPNAELRRTWSAVRWMSGRPSRHRINGLRTLGGQAARGEVVAYLDDDSIVQPQWLEALVSAYGAEDVCGAGGRVIENGGSRTSGGEVGRLGALLEPVGNFHLNGEAVREVDHLRGCNFSFRRRCLEEVGWFHDGYHGWCLRDDTDICLTLREGGHRLVFEPRAVVRHLAGEQGTSSRNTYSLRWAYVGARWHSYFVVRHGGRQFGSRWRYLVIEPLVEPLRILRQAGKLGLRWVVSLAGRVVGVSAGVYGGLRGAGRRQRRGGRGGDRRVGVDAASQVGAGDSAKGDVPAVRQQ